MSKVKVRTLDQFKDEHFGKRGTKKREEYESGFREFYKKELAEIAREEKLKASKRRVTTAATSRSRTRP